MSCLVLSCLVLQPFRSVLIFVPIVSGHSIDMTQCCSSWGFFCLGGDGKLDPICKEALIAVNKAY